MGERRDYRIIQELNKSTKKTQDLSLPPGNTQHCESSVTDGFISFSEHHRDDVQNI